MNIDGDEGYLGSPGSPGGEDSRSQVSDTGGLSQDFSQDYLMDSQDEAGSATATAAAAAAGTATATAAAAAAVTATDVFPMLVYCMDSISSSLSGTMGIYIPPTIVETLSSEILRKQTRKKVPLTVEELLNIYDRLNDTLYLSVKSYLEKLIPDYDVDLLNRSVAATKAFCLNEILRDHYEKRGAVDDKLSDLIKKIKRNIGLLYSSGDIDVSELSVMLRGLKEYNSYLQLAKYAPTLKDKIILGELQNPNTFKSFDDYIKNQLIGMMSEKGFYPMLFGSEDVRTNAIELFSNLNDNLSMVVGLILHDISEIFAKQELVEAKKKDNEDLINKVIGLFIEIPIKLIVINMLIDKDLPNDLDSYLYAIEGVSNDYATSDIDDDDDSGMGGGAATIDDDDADMPAASAAPEKTLYDRAQEVITGSVPEGDNPYKFESDKIDNLIQIMNDSLKISQERSQAELAEEARELAEEARRKAAQAAEARKIKQAKERERLKAKERARLKAEKSKAGVAPPERGVAPPKREIPNPQQLKIMLQEAEKIAKKGPEIVAARAGRKAKKSKAGVPPPKTPKAPPAIPKAVVAPPAGPKEVKSNKRKPKKQPSAQSKKPKSTTAEVTGIQPRAAAQAQAEGVINPAAAEAEGATAAAETAATQRPYASQNRGEGTTEPPAKAAKTFDDKTNKKGGMSLLQYQTGGSNESYYLYQENLHLIIRELLIKLKTDLQKTNVKNLNYYSATYDVFLKFLMIHEESENIKKDGSKLIKKMQEAVMDPTAAAEAEGAAAEGAAAAEAEGRQAEGAAAVEQAEAAAAKAAE